MRIEKLAATFASGVHHVSADIDGLPLWFESPDLELGPAPEAFASAMLIPALSKGESVVLEEACDAQWRTNVETLQQVVCEWWGFRIRSPRTPDRSPVGSSPAPGTALCFSGGVDSFFSLLRYPKPIDYLVTVQGFDITLDDVVRFARVEETTRNVAAEIGAKAVVIRTNLRRHRHFNECPWTRSHGGALAAVGHLLDRHVGRLVVSSSITYADDHPWGSHWRLDPLWSSSRLEMVYFGADHRRGDKLIAIAQEPLVRQHLRVCWEHRSASGNCSKCEKCIRTRLGLASCGALDFFPGFDGTASLARDVDNLKLGRARGRVYARLLERGGLDPTITQSLQRLVARVEAEQPQPPMPRGFLRRAVSRAFGVK
jgi:hypothetical protein